MVPDPTVLFQKHLLQNTKHAEPDYLLQELVGSVNLTEGAGIGVTLQIGGMLVSGTLISGKEFFSLYAASLSNVTGESDEDRAATLKYFNERAEAIYAEPEVDPDVERVLPGMIHLKHASFFTDGTKPIASDGTLWRGRIASVDGFFLGTLGVQKAS